MGGTPPRRDRGDSITWRCRDGEGREGQSEATCGEGQKRAVVWGDGEMGRRGRGREGYNHLHHVLGKVDGVSRRAGELALVVDKPLGEVLVVEGVPVVPGGHICMARPGEIVGESFVGSEAKATSARWHPRRRAPPPSSRGRPRAFRCAFRGARGGQPWRRQDGHFWAVPVVRAVDELPLLLAAHEQLPEHHRLRLARGGKAAQRRSKGRVNHPEGNNKQGG